MSVWNPKQSKILASFFELVTRTLPPPFFSFERENSSSLFSTKSNFTNATNSTKEESLATNERTNERTRDDEKRATFLSSRAKWAATRVGFLRVVSLCVVSSFFFSERELEMPKRLPVYNFERLRSSSFCLLSEGKDVPTKEIETRVRGRGEDDATKTRRAKKNKVSSRTLSFERIRCARFEGVFCARKVEQRVVESARACVWRKKYYGEIVSPHSHKKKEKKISWSFFCPFFALFLALFFSHLFFFRSRFPLFWREGKSFTEFRVLVFPIVFYNTTTKLHSYDDVLLCLRA